MRKLFLIVLTLISVGIVSLNAQLYCTPDSQVDSGIDIDKTIISYSDILSDTIIVPDGNAVQALNDTIEIFEGEFMTFQFFSSIDTTAPIIDSVYWRVSLDEDADGSFDPGDVLYTSDLVPTGEHTAEINIPNYNFAYNANRRIFIELATDTTYFGDCNVVVDSNGHYSGFTITGRTKDGKLVVKSGSGTSGSSLRKHETLEKYAPVPCEDCLPLNDTLIYKLYTADNTSIYDVDLSSLEIRDGKYDQYIPSTADIVEVLVYNASNSGTPITTSPFDFDLGGSDTALIKIRYQLAAGERLFPSGNKGKIIGVFNYKTTPTATSTEVEIGDFNLAIGCYPETSVLYDFHASTVTSSENLLPFYTGSYTSITAQDDVTVNTGDEVIFKVDDAGFIKITGGVQIESGSYFWAYKGEPCLEPATPSLVSPVVESRFEASYINEELYCYPNPFRNWVAIQLPIEMTEVRQLVIVDALGNVVQQIRVAPEQRILKVDTAHWATGIYFVQILNGRNTQLTKIIKSE